MRTFLNLYFLGILISSLFSYSEVVGTIDRIDGKVTIKSNNNIQPSRVPILGGPIYSGDRINTGDVGELSISLENSSDLLTIYSETDLSISGAKSSSKFILDYGNIFVEILSGSPSNHKFITESSLIKLTESECLINRKLSGEDSIYTLLGNVEIKNLRDGREVSLGMGKSIKSDSDSLHNKIDIKEGMLPVRIYKRYRKNIDLINAPPTFTVMNLFSDELLVNKVAKKKKVNIIVSTGISSIHDQNYINLSFSPFYKIENKRNNIIFGYNFSGFLGASDTAKSFNKFSDLSYLLAPLIFQFNSKRSGSKIEIGEIENLSFGYGSLINNYTNSISPPEKQDAGLVSITYSKSGRNKSKIFVSSFVESAKGGGLSGLYHERKLGDDGLLLGMGIVIDHNQFVGVLDTLWGEEIAPHKRMITGLSLNFTYKIKSSLRNDTFLFGEATSLLYDSNLRYIRSEMINGKMIQQGYERNSSFGFKGPGIWWKIGHHKNLRIALNYSSALYTTPFFNETYSLERGNYISLSVLDSLEENEPYSIDDDWNTMITSNYINLDDTLYFLPKDIYMLLDATHNAHNKMGLSIEYSQSYRNYFNLKFNFDSYQQVGSIQTPQTYYNFGLNFAINNGLLKRVSSLEIYFNQYFTSDLFNISEYAENVTMGANIELDIMKNISLKIYRHDVFYDSNLDGEVDLNSTLGLGLVAKY